MARRRTDDDDYFLCPNCGARLPTRAEFCRHCGASDESGWNEEAGLDEEAEEDFEYEEFLRREFPEHAPPRSTKEQLQKLVLVVVVVLLCLAFLAWMLLPPG